MPHVVLCIRVSAFFSQVLAGEGAVDQAGRWGTQLPHLLSDVEGEWCRQCTRSWGPARFCVLVLMFDPPHRSGVYVRSSVSLYRV